MDGIQNADEFNLYVIAVDIIIRRAKESASGV